MAQKGEYTQHQQPNDRTFALKAELPETQLLSPPQPPLGLAPSRYDSGAIRQAAQGKPAAAGAIFDKPGSHNNTSGILDTSMDDRAEHGMHGDPAKEASNNLETRYSTLGQNIAKIYKATTQEEPKTLLRRFRDGDFRRVKDTRATDTLVRVRDVFQTHFPDQEQQEQVAQAADNYLSKLASSITPDEMIFDQHISNFIASFPDNIMTELGDHISPDTVKRIFQMGSNAIDVHMKKVADTSEEMRRYLTGNYINGSLGWISTLIAADIPQAIRNAGDSREALITRLEEASKQPLSVFEAMGKYYNQGTYEPSSETRESIASLQAHFDIIDPNADTSSSPFNKPDREPWRNEIAIGVENRVATWQDLADMVRSTEEDDIEYGMTFSRDEDHADSRIDFKRGRNTYIFNKGHSTRGREDMVFIHAHPSHQTFNSDPTYPEWNSLCSPLVSPGDMLATGLSDYGGSYYNVVTANGITFHTGIQKEGTPDIEYLTGLDSRDEIYTIESGEEKGESFLQKGENEDKIITIMRKIKEAGKPFVYSIYEPVQMRRHFFVHLPWNNIDGSIPFEQMLYGNGLKELVEKIDDLPEIPMARSVQEGLRHSINNNADLKNVDDKG